MELTITKEKVLEAASKCSTAKATLEVLFPEVFEKNKAVSCGATDLKSSNENNFFEVHCATTNERIMVTANGHAPKGLEFQCFSLGSDFNWELREYNDRQILIPTRKP